uniref:Uncharacterized protein n=1 Tax=Anas platyrhynchos platyrhynchos TaxID=8840 RepID=A0A493TMR5_ANAPP
MPILQQKIFIYAFARLKNDLQNDNSASNRHQHCIPLSEKYSCGTVWLWGTLPSLLNSGELILKQEVILFVYPDAVS